MAWVKVVGLILDSAGAVFLAVGLIVTKERAAELGVPRWAGSTLEENLKLVPVREILRQSRRAVVGSTLLLLGFVLQVIANWPR